MPPSCRTRLTRSFIVLPHTSHCSPAHIFPLSLQKRWWFAEDDVGYCFRSVSDVSAALRGGRSPNEPTDAAGRRRGPIVALSLEQHADWRHVAFTRARHTDTVWSQWLFGSQVHAQHISSPKCLASVTVTHKPLPPPWKHRSECECAVVGWFVVF
jgi:hypothetical protein